MKKKSNFRRFLLLWTGELVSFIGGGLTSFGLGVYIFQQTGGLLSRGADFRRGAADSYPE